MTTPLPALLLLALAVAPTDAADLPRLRRPPTKEPVYGSKKPVYAMAAFGREANKRVWLVLDGETLYVDRAGDGDLTRPDCQVKAKASQGALVYSVGAIVEGDRKHTKFKLAVTPVAGFSAEMRQMAADADPSLKKLLADPAARLFTLSANVVVPGFQGTGDEGRVVQTAYGQVGDSEGVLQFADRPADAPIVHFGGPWSIALFPPQPIPLGHAHDLKVAIATPGVGPGTLVVSHYQGVVPEEAFPVVEIAFPAKVAGQEPIRRKWTLKQRC